MEIRFGMKVIRFYFAQTTSHHLPKYNSLGHFFLKDDVGKKINQFWQIMTGYYFRKVIIFNLRSIFYVKHT